MCEREEETWEHVEEECMSWEEWRTWQETVKFWGRRGRDGLGREMEEERCECKCVWIYERVYGRVEKGKE